MRSSSARNGGDTLENVPVRADVDFVQREMVDRRRRPDIEPLISGAAQHLKRFSASDRRGVVKAYGQRDQANVAYRA